VRATRVGEHGRRGLIDTGEGRSGACPHGLRRPEHHGGERERVDAQVEQGSTTEFGSEQPVLRVGLEPHSLIGRNGQDLAYRALPEQFPQATQVRQEAAPHRLHAEHPGVPGGHRHGPGLDGVHRERLLHQHSLAGGDGRQGVLGVKRVRGRDVDDVHLRVGDQGGDRAVPTVDPEPVGELLGAGRRPRSDGDSLGIGEKGEIGDEPRGDATGADHPPADRCGHGPQTRAW
jgi:hypothetical protein